MTSSNDFDRALSAFMAEVAPAREPEALLGQVLARSARTRRRAAWRIPDWWLPAPVVPVQTWFRSWVPVRMVAVLGLLLVALVIGAVVLSGSQRRDLPPPFGPAGNGRLVTNEAMDIVVRDSLTGEVTVLIGGETFDFTPRFAIDGSRFAFLRLLDAPYGSDVDLWIAAPDGSGARRLAGPFGDHVREYAWSPSGDAIAVQTEVGDQGTITIVPTDGAAPSRLEVGVSAWQPEWRAPDGRQLLFLGVDATGATGLYLVDRDGSGLTRIDLDIIPGAEPDIFLFFFSLSSDGRHIAYGSLPEDPDGPLGPGFQIHVVEIGPMGEVLDDIVVPHAVGISDNEPEFLPQGDRLLFQRTTSADVRSLAMVGIGRAQEVVDFECCAAPEYGRQISPDGTQLLFRPTMTDPYRSIDLASGQVSNVALERSDGATIDAMTWQRLANDP